MCLSQKMNFLRPITILVIITTSLILTGSCLRMNVDYSDPRYDDMLNTCIDSQNHKKSRPGAENELHGQVRKEFGL